MCDRQEYEKFLLQEYGLASTCTLCTCDYNTERETSHRGGNFFVIGII